MDDKKSYSKPELTMYSLLKEVTGATITCGPGAVLANCNPFCDTGAEVNFVFCTSTCSE